MALFGVVQFGRLYKMLSAEFTMTQGISPSVATLVMPPVQGAQFLSDTMSFRYGRNSVRFPNCRVDAIDVTQDSQGAEVWRLRVLDRRWLWRETGQISGTYNTRKAGGNIVKGTRKNAQELAHLCLSAMQERGFIGLLPRNVYPEVHWDVDNPAEALAALCESLNYVVVLGYRGFVEIWPKNFGRNLPSYGSLEGGYTVDPPDPPGELVVVGDRVRWQVDLPIEPVGLEKDGTVRHVRKLTYCPVTLRKKTWALADFPHFNSSIRRDARARELARTSVYRWFRVKTPFWVPGIGKVDDLDRILPLEDSQIELADSRRPVKGEPPVDPQPRPPWIWGMFAQGFEDTRPNVQRLNPDIERDPKQLYTGEFSLDTENGIVKFKDQVFRYWPLPWRGAGSAMQVGDPALYLRVAVTLKEPGTNAILRQPFSNRNPRSRHRTRKRFIERPELAREIYVNWKRPAKLVDNHRELAKQAKVYLVQAALEYQTKQGASFTYPGFLPIGCDGAIQQVTWSLTPEGFAITRATRNTEDLTLGSGYDERRFIETLSKVIRDNEKRTPRRAKRDIKRTRGR